MNKKMALLVVPPWRAAFISQGRMYIPLRLMPFFYSYCISRFFFFNFLITTLISHQSQGEYLKYNNGILTLSKIEYNVLNSA